MHNSWLLRNSAAIEIQRICRGFLAKKRVVMVRRNMYTRPEYKNAIVECVGDMKQLREEGAEILREQIRYLRATSRIPVFGCVERM